MGSTGPNIDTADILSRLTIDEKISLLAAKDWWRTHSIDREGVFVPHIKTTDGPNGARGESYVSGIRAACFPCGTNMGATFDTDLVRRMGEEVAKEAISKAANVLLAPTLNVIRSPLGGRNYETYSEDPFVLGTLAAAYINGCQSLGIAATPKHFVANEAENRRFWLSVELDEQTLREIYLLPFQLVLKNSMPLCFMTAYNRINGTYVAEDRNLLDGVLRKEWGFRGLILSDWTGTYSTTEGINAGVDIEMPGPTKWRGAKLLEAYKDGCVSIETIDRSAKRVLDLAKALGRWDHPVEPPEIEIESADRDNFIRDAAIDGMVLLKNEENVLPIPHDANLAIIGYLGRYASLGGGGSARVDALHSVSVLDGLKALDVKYTFSPGVPIHQVIPHAEPAIISAVDPWIATGTFVPGKTVKLEWFNGAKIDQHLVHQEWIASAEYMIKEAWPQYLDHNYCTRMSFSLTPITTGKHTFSIITTGVSVCYIDGQKVFERQQEQDLRLESFYFYKPKLERRFEYEMTGGRVYNIVLESWACDPQILFNPPLNGKMFQGAAVRFFEYIDISNAISQAAIKAKSADYAIVCIGNTNEIESEGYDRETMDLPGAQYELVRAVAAANPRTVVVNFSGAPVTLTQILTEVPSVLQAWFPGQECGHAVARILMGVANPNGHLPFSWPAKVEDNSACLNFPVDANDLLHYTEGLDVGYRYHDRPGRINAQFPFGFGLSYTTFKLSDVTLSSQTMSHGVDGVLNVSCQVSNTGSCAGKVAIQFYIQFPKITQGYERPVKELKAFQKVCLNIGESRTVTVKLDKYAVSYWNSARSCWQAVSGIYIVKVGTSSHTTEEASFKVPEEYTWNGI